MLPERVGVIFQRTAARMRTSWGSAAAQMKGVNDRLRQSMSDLNRTVDGVRDGLSKAREAFRDFDAQGARGITVSLRRASAGFKAFRNEMSQAFEGRERSGMSRLAQTFSVLGRTVRTTAAGLALAVGGIAAAVGTAGAALGGFARVR